MLTTTARSALTTLCWKWTKGRPLPPPMSQKKVYNMKIDTAVVVVGTKSEVPMYLSHMGEENIVMTVKDFKRFLEKEKFEKDNNVDVTAIAQTIASLGE